MKKSKENFAEIIFDLFCDSAEFLRMAEINEDETDVCQRYCRASILASWAGFEAWINKTCTDFANNDNKLALLERALLLERRINFEEGEFRISNSIKYESVENKLEFLIARYGKQKLRKNTLHWNRFKESKKIRDSITHPKVQSQTYVEIVETKENLQVLKHYLKFASKQIYNKEPSL